ncbi:hypothetical protein NW768_005864 [Fusarium equiseti]|uniref:Uncharacterized protein n=1 Tax=Fusarium equiseti TaxID=61235 RepID=A0ABQ8RD22_FUSEQ|nr:hypothetical protein NW768_005864 [Fusarium equiseti]
MSLAQTLSPTITMAGRWKVPDQAPDWFKKWGKGRIKLVPSSNAPNVSEASSVAEAHVLNEDEPAASETAPAVDPEADSIGHESRGSKRIITQCGYFIVDLSTGVADMFPKPDVHFQAYLDSYYDHRTIPITSRSAEAAVMVVFPRTEEPAGPQDLGYGSIRQANPYLGGVVTVVPPRTEKPACPQDNSEYISA